MIKTKWLEFSADITISGLSNALSQHQFNRDSKSGFELIEVTNKYLHGRFVEEIISNEISLDPFGEEVINVLRRYQIFEFFILPLKNQQFLIRVDSPPRSIKLFISTMAKCFGFGFVVNSIDINILSLINHFKLSNIANHWIIKKIYVSNIRLTETSLAKIEVYSKANAYTDLQQMLEIKHSILERATVEYTLDGAVRQIELVAKGLIIADIEFLEKLTPFFISYLLSK